MDRTNLSKDQPGKSMKIGIIGASSQVGSSLALHLKEHPGIVPVCFIRSAYPAVFFDISGIEYRVIDLHNQTALKRDFEDINLFIDCSYPSGQLYEIADEIKRQLKIFFAAMPAEASFIYCSTIMAFGMPDGQKQVKNYFIPLSTYAHLKRIAEKTVNRIANQYNISAFIFRLGQVHGFLQSVNTSYREKLSMNKTITLDGNPTDLVNIIFIETLAEAVIRVGLKEMATGSYSLVNYPQWTLKQLYDYYISCYSLENKVQFIKDIKSSTKRSGYKISLAPLKKYRALLETFFLIRNKKIYIKVKGKYRRMNVRHSVNVNTKSDYTDFHLLGKNPGLLINGLSSEPHYILNKEKNIEKSYNMHIENNIGSF